MQKRIEEFAAECSILKFVGSEIFVNIANEMLQLHGGYGYVEEYPAERNYRDAKINMIFEGTNEINRMITTGWMMKRANAGQLPLLPAIQTLMDEVAAGQAAKAEFRGPLASQKALLASAKKLALFCIGSASKRFGKELPDQQEVTGALSEIIAEVLMMESAILRAEKMSASKPLSVKLASYYAGQSFRTVEASAQCVLSSLSEGDDLRANMAIFWRLCKHEPANLTVIGREISTAMVAAGQFAI